MRRITPKSRKVTGVERDSQGQLETLCVQITYRIPVSQVIKDIRTNEARYGANSPYYTDVGGVKAAVVVAERDGKPYLRTDPDKTTRNNLDALPDC